MLTNCWEKGAYSRRTGEGGYDKGETGEHPLFLQFRSTALWPDTSIHKPARGKALRYARNVQLLIDTSRFPTFPSEPDPVAAEIQPPSGWAQACGTAHRASGRGACWELASSCYQHALSNRSVSPNVIFASWEHRGDLGVIQLGAQHGGFGPTEVCLLRGPLHGSQGRNVCKAMHVERAWWHQTTFPRTKQSNPTVKKVGEKPPFPTIRRKCCIMWAAVRNWVGTVPYATTWREIISTTSQRTSKHFAGFYHSCSRPQRLAHKVVQIQAIRAQPLCPDRPCSVCSISSVLPEELHSYFLFFSEISVTNEDKGSHASRLAQL